MSEGPVVTTAKQAEAASAEKTQVSELTAFAQRQEALLRKQLRHQRIRTILALLVAAAVLFLVWRVLPLTVEAQELLSLAQQAVGDMNEVINSLDLSTTLRGIDDLIKQSSDMVAQSSDVVAQSSGQITSVMQTAQSAMNDLASVDFAGLQESLDRLSRVIAVLAQFFGVK